LSFFTSAVWGSRDKATRAPTFVPVERSLRPPVRLFAPLRDKVIPAARRTQGLRGQRLQKNNTTKARGLSDCLSVPPTETGLGAVAGARTNTSLGRGRYLRGWRPSVRIARGVPGHYARAREAVPIFRMTFPSQTAGEYVERRCSGTKTGTASCATIRQLAWRSTAAPSWHSLCGRSVKVAAHRQERQQRHAGLRQESRSFARASTECESSCVTGP
jgi:hypothetical protein